MGARSRTWNRLPASILASPYRWVLWLAFVAVACAACAGAPKSASPSLITPALPSAQTPTTPSASTPPSVSPQALPTGEVAPLLARIPVVPVLPNVSGYDRSCSPGKGPLTELTAQFAQV